MLFVPPRCPNPACDRHLNPTPGFFVRRGYYQPACRRERVPRFRCRTCNRGFSRQTFRQDYRDRRPADNAILFMLLASGVGLRQAGRVLKMNARSVQDKKCKMARMLALLHENLSQTLPKGSCFLLDEEETYEGASIRPLTMPVMIEKETWFVVDRTFDYIGKLISGRESADQLSGPIRIAQVSGQVASLGGIGGLAGLVAVLSVSIGLINLFPIPMLDGGHLLFYAVEAIRGRPLSDRAQEIGFRIGFAIVVMLMLFSTWNDIIHLGASFTARGT